MGGHRRTKKELRSADDDQRRERLAREHSHRRLEHLYEISKLLSSFVSLEQTGSAALAIATDTLPLHSAIVIEATDEQTRMITWQADHPSRERIRAAKQHAQDAYAYLVGGAPTGGPARSDEAGRTEALARPGARLKQEDETKFIVIPLVGDRRRVFGVLQLESTVPLLKPDLVFVNAFANQLAVALDRHRAWQGDISLRVRAEQAVQLRERIIEIVSHDLRNPLWMVLMSASQLAKQAAQADWPKRDSSAVTRIHAAAAQMTRLIEDLLDFASVQAGRLQIKREPGEPAAIVQEAFASFGILAEQKNVRLGTEVDPELPLISGDRERLLQVFSNLIGNALKVTRPGGSIVLSVKADLDQVVFAVRDTGPGIAEHDLQHLFERYWRSGEAGYKGTGLGLSITQGIVEAHGGRIWVESQPGQGTTFFFTVPVVGAQEWATAPEHLA